MTWMNELFGAFRYFSCGLIMGNFNIEIKFFWRWGKF